MSTGKSLRVFLVDGAAGGLLTAEIMNWTGHVIAAPRSALPSLLDRPEVTRTGIYLLLGEDPDSGSELGYVGEGDDVRKRLTQHAKTEDQGGKDFWQRAIVITSKDTNLTKAHARYLESRLISMANGAKRVQLTNGTAPVTLPLPEADISDMEYFIEQIRIVLPVLGVNIFRTTASTTTGSGTATAVVSIPQPSSPQFRIALPKETVNASAQEVDGEFIVREGSVARRQWIGTVVTGYQVLRNKLEGDGTLIPTADGRGMIFTHDQVFASPSAAAAVVTGRNSNGRNDDRGSMSAGVAFQGRSEDAVNSLLAALDMGNAGFV